jgi:hypothetical protein
VFYGNNTEYLTIYTGLRRTIFLHTGTGHAPVKKRAGSTGTDIFIIVPMRVS